MRNQLRLFLLILGVSLLVCTRGGAASAQTDTLRVSFHFRFDNAVLMPSYKNNALTLRQLDTLFSKLSPEQIECVILEGTSSPEGANRYNQVLAMRRVTSVKNCITERYPDINADSICMTWKVTPISVLRDAVEKELSVPNRDRVLRILDSQRSWITKWENIKLLSGGAAPYISQNIFPAMRNVVTCVIVIEQPNSAKSIALTPAQKSATPLKEGAKVVVDSLATTDTAGVSSTTNKAGTTCNTRETDTAKSKLADSANDDAKGVAQRMGGVAQRAEMFAQMAIKTNVLYGVSAGAPNLAFEYALNDRTTIDTRLGINAWGLTGTKDDNKKLAHWMLQSEYRYWFKSSFLGHFVGVNAFGGVYNLGGYSFPNMFLGGKIFDSDYRYHGWIAGAGVSYGYQYHFNKNWGVELNIGIGVAHLNYDKYDCMKCGEMIDTENRTYFGPTRAGVSLIYYINSRKK